MDYLLKNKNLEKDSFTEKLTGIIKVRRNYRKFSGIDDHLGSIFSQIRKRPIGIGISDIL